MTTRQWDPLEPRTHEIGRELFDAVRRHQPSIFSRGWWDDWLMNSAMGDDALKAPMFRFVDVLPALGNHADVLAHFREYLSDTAALEQRTGRPVQLPWHLRLALRMSEPETLRGRLVAWAIHFGARRMATRFIAGNSPAEVMAAVSRLRDYGMCFTLDLLGEATVSEREADEYLRRYLELIEYLESEVRTWSSSNGPPRTACAGSGGQLPIINLSIKISALTSHFDPISPAHSIQQVAPRLRELFRAAKAHGALVNVDMEQYDLKDLTLQTFCTLLEEDEFRDWPDVGIALQAYLIEAEDDLRQLRDWAERRGTPVWVRLVKGAYWDFEVVMARQRQWPAPVFLQKWQSDASFERCTDFLLENRQWLRPAIASHNLRSIAHALAVAEASDIPPDDLEFQMLYGMATPLKYALIERGHRLRVYAPFGEMLPGMSYLVRRLLENTSNTSFLRAAFTEGQSIEEMLGTPINRYEQTPQ